MKFSQKMHAPATVGIADVIGVSFETSIGIFLSKFIYPFHHTLYCFLPLGGGGVFQAFQEDFSDPADALIINKHGQVLNEKIGVVVPVNVRGY